MTEVDEDSLDKEILLALTNETKQHPKVPLWECSIDNYLLYVYGLFYVRNNETLYPEWTMPTMTTLRQVTQDALLPTNLLVGTTGG